MTTIKSATSRDTLNINDAFTDGTLFVDIERRGETVICITVPRAELLVALGAPDEGEFNHRIKYLEEELSAVKANRDHIVNGFQEFKDRAERAEAKLARLLADPDARELALASARAREADEARIAAINRAEAAEAKLQKVREWVHDWRDDYATEAFKEIDAILNPPAGFALPTEAGAKFEVTLRGPAGCTVIFTTLAGWSEPLYACDLYSDWYTAAEVMAEFTNHRLIGAES